mmetsp:Transcript_89342/g.238933  ORF Transcript_89342/g.238933 Transcript_89342/m.238933 type:complete len:81 (-) Transcript_89342:740-982(-)
MALSAGQVDLAAASAARAATRIPKRHRKHAVQVGMETSMAPASTPFHQNIFWLGLLDVKGNTLPCTQTSTLPRPELTTVE